MHAKEETIINAKLVIGNLAAYVVAAGSFMESFEIFKSIALFLGAMVLLYYQIRVHRARLRNEQKSAKDENNS